ncbi:hypothetical protein RUND412_008383 [Rhizina undulata]
MAEPTEVQATAAGDERPLPSNAEDAKRVKAMEAVESNDSDAGGVTQVSAEALGKAMQDLSVSKPSAGPKATSVAKVNAADVTLIVEEMEISKVKATDVLRSCGGDVSKALRTLLARN